MARPNRFAPERHHLPFGEWPSQDQTLWQALVQPGATVLDDSGAFARLAPLTRAMKRVSYSTWLNFIRLGHPALWLEAPPARVTPATVAEWFAQLGQLVAPQTRLMRAIGLLNVMTAAAPATDWGWLHKAVARLRHNAAPGNRKAGRVRSSSVLFALGLRLMAEVEAADTTAPAAVVAATGTWAPVPKTKLRRAELLRAVRYRDGLMIALLALRPLRIRNLVGLEIGRTLFAAAENEPRIVIGASDTKTKKPIDLEWPADLEPQLQRYLNRYRPWLLRHGTSSMLWIGQFGQPMATDHIVRAVIVGRTREGLGVPISPHLFRDCAATTIANEDPGHIGIASSLLGHASIRTTDRHYRQANSINASSHYEAARAVLRAQLRPGADRNRLRRRYSTASSLTLLSDHRDRKTLDSVDGDGTIASDNDAQRS